MKTIINSLLFAVALILFSSCKKDGFSTVPLSSLKIGNYVTGGTTAKLRGVYSTVINNNANANYGMLVGSQELYVYPEADSIRPYYHGNNKIVLDEGASYSLFLGGTPSAITSLFLHENWSRPKGSIYIRVLNFSPGAPPVSVNLSTDAVNSDFSNVSFGQLTDFKAYTKAGTAPAYTFQVRNANTKALIASHALSSTIVSTYNHITLVLRGVVGGDPAAGVSRCLHN